MKLTAQENVDANLINTGDWLIGSKASVKIVVEVR